MFSKVLLTQFSIPSLNMLEYKSNAHLAPGYLVGYAREQCPNTDFVITPRIYTDALATPAFIDYAIAQQADLLTFSLYLWNLQRSLEVARVLKNEIPGVTILFGGPEVNPDNEFLLNSNVFTEGITGEGEVSFLDYLLDKPKDGIGGLLTKDRHNNFSKLRTSYSPDKNPYIAELIETKPDSTIFFETVRGCPFSCNFCYYNKVYDKIIPIGTESVRAFVEYADAHGITELFLLDPSFNVQPGFDEILDLLIGLNKDKRFKISTELRADLLTKTQIDKLSQLNLVEAEIGLQSTNPKALEIIGKKDSSEKTIEQAQAMSIAGIDCKVDLIVGLPGDTLEDFKRTIDDAYVNNIHDAIQIFRLAILPGTEFANNREKYGIVADRKPPYYIESTPTFSSDEIIQAFEYAEEVFGVTLYPIPPFLLSTDFADLDAKDYVNFDSDISPIHKIVFSSDEYELKYHRSKFCETLALHFIITDPKKQCDKIVETLAFFNKEFPDNYYQLILDFRNDVSSDLVQNTYQALPQNLDSLLNKDAISHLGTDLRLSSRLAVIVPWQIRARDDIQKLNQQCTMFLAVDMLDEALLEECYDDYNLYFTGPEQNKIYKYLEQHESLDDFTVFDSFKLEKNKQDAHGGTPLYLPHVLNC